MGLQLNCLLLNGHIHKHYKVSCYVEVELSTLHTQFRVLYVTVIVGLHSDFTHVAFHIKRALISTRICNG
jgi:hypothetical protein